MSQLFLSLSLFMGAFFPPQLLTHADVRINLLITCPQPSVLYCDYLSSLLALIALPFLHRASCSRLARTNIHLAVHNSSSSAYFQPESHRTTQISHIYKQNQLIRSGTCFASTTSVADLQSSSSSLQDPHHVLALEPLRQLTFSPCQIFFSSIFLYTAFVNSTAVLLSLH